MAVKQLAPERLYQRCDPEQFDFTTTEDLEDLSDVIGQPRAVEAVRFDLDYDGLKRRVIRAESETASHQVHAKRVGVVVVAVDERSKFARSNFTDFGGANIVVRESPGDGAELAFGARV